ncbi:MAG TPA: OmpA family protein [Thermoanaerobaculia bacterium]|jgi:outer membrane protein OmpA-like peptidoglycan-associated protein|nr:OmpA family protein [Thermoanaerobaculia bacterium]
MRWPRLGAALLLPLLLGSAPLRAGERPAYPDPWDAATQAAAEAAVARLGTHRALDVERHVLAIQGSEQGIAGARGGITATVQELHQAMQALGATESALEVTVSLPADVLFDFDKAEIRPDAAAALARLATVIRAYPAGRAEIQGHTDAKGNAAYNRALSERRAEAVKRWLVEREKIAADHLATRGFGKSRPVADNGTEAGRQKNRRVEVVVQKGR